MLNLHLKVDKAEKQQNIKTTTTTTTKSKFNEQKTVTNMVNVKQILHNQFLM